MLASIGTRRARSRRQVDAAAAIGEHADPAAPRRPPRAVHRRARPSARGRAATSCVTAVRTAASEALTIAASRRAGGGRRRAGAPRASAAWPRSGDSRALCRRHGGRGVSADRSSRTPSSRSSTPAPAGSSARPSPASDLVRAIRCRRGRTHHGRRTAGVRPTASARMPAGDRAARRTGVSPNARSSVLRLAATGMSNRQIAERALPVRAHRARLPEEPLGQARRALEAAGGGARHLGGADHPPGAGHRRDGDDPAANGVPTNSASMTRPRPVSGRGRVGALLHAAELGEVERPTRQRGRAVGSETVEDDAHVALAQLRREVAGNRGRVRDAREEHRHVGRADVGTHRAGGLRARARARSSPASARRAPARPRSRARSPSAPRTHGGAGGTRAAPRRTARTRRPGRRTPTPRAPSPAATGRAARTRR